MSEEKKDNLWVVTPKYCREAASALLRAFIWNEMEEGGKFWADVHDRLNELADKAEAAQAQEAEEANEERG